MSTSIYDVGGDIGNWAAKVVRDGKSVVIRNVATRYDGSEDGLRGLGMFGARADESSAQTESARITLGGQEWVVGELAYELNLRSYESTTYARYGTDEWFALIAASFVTLYENH